MEHFDLNDVKNSDKKRGGSCILASSKKKISRKAVAAMVDLKHLDVPLVATTIRLERDQPYTIGRSGRLCQLVFDDRRVSKQHCQILFDASLRKLYLLDGAFSFSPTTSSSGGSCFLANQCGNRFVPIPSDNPDARVRASLNGVFVNGVRIRKGLVMELSAGDEVLLVCADDQGLCGSRLPMGFLIQRIVFEEEVLLQGCNDIPLPITSQGHSQGSASSGKFNKRIFALRANSSALSISKWDDLVGRANSLSTLCRTILQSDDPISYIRRYPFSVQSSPTVEHPGEKVVAVKADSNHHSENVSARGDRFCHKEYFGIPSENANISSLNSVGKENPPHFDGVMWNETCGNICPPPGKSFYLNRLEIMNQSLFSHRAVVSLPELLHPVESISRLFIATFTSDILWFLSYCKVPCHLPVTLACHNTERCWSAGPDKRSSVPYPDFPNLVVVYPPFPDAVAFGKDRKKQGIACHHPKLLVSQRENSIRVIITSANLVAKQWNKVTNTIWWQDFPRRSSPNYSSLFTQIHDRDTSKDANSDFAAQLARFIASLLTDVPSQAHWIIELTKYDFEGADGYLIASVPGIHSYRAPAMIESTRFLPANHWASCSFGVKFLGSVEASVVGLSHLFRTAAGSNGAQLKKLAAFLGKSCDRAYGMSEIVLRRNKNVPADANAVCVLVPNPDKFFVGDFVQLGFLPRIVAKWVSPLWDIGFFRFSGCVCPKEALAAALGGNGMNIQLMLYVSQGPHFQDISKMMQPKHVVALCSLIASVQSNSGLWRLQEVLGQYRWPESLESDFIYGSSSIGSAVNPQFLAAFSTASGKRSLQSFESEESDPEWGCWNASQELKSPSIRIIFPTIERVKNACSGILPSKRILCFSERTWQRLRTVDILHDAIPHPYNRVGHPMHVKVARRRFQSKKDARSFGWVYCGSHNFSAAAWGRPVSNPFGCQDNGFEKGKSPLGRRLHICNYELGIIFIFPPTETKGGSDKNCSNLDDVVLPFVVPAPKYGPRDRPATGQAMREALSELTEQERERDVEIAAAEEMMEEIPDEEEEAIEATHYFEEEKEEEKAYAEMLWSQVDSSQTC